MGDPVPAARIEWTAARRAVDAVAEPAELAAWHAFLPAAIESLAGPAGLDGGLEVAREHVRRGLEALAAPAAAA